MATEKQIKAKEAKEEREAKLKKYLEKIKKMRRVGKVKPVDMPNVGRIAGKVKGIPSNFDAKMLKELLPKMESYKDNKRFNPKRDKDGNRIPFVNPEPKRFNPKRDKDGNRIPFDPKTGIQLLNKGGEVKKYKHGGSVNKNTMATTKGWGKSRKT
jgi:hypothetical protein